MWVAFSPGQRYLWAQVTAGLGDLGFWFIIGMTGRRVDTVNVAPHLWLESPFPSFSPDDQHYAAVVALDDGAHLLVDGVLSPRYDQIALAEQPFAADGTITFHASRRGMVYRVTFTPPASPPARVFHLPPAAATGHE